MRKIIIPNAVDEDPARFLWMIEPGDVILLDKLPDKHFIDYLCKLKNLPQDSFEMVTLSTDWRKTFSPEVLLSDEVVNKIKMICGDDPAFIVSPYIYNPTVIELAERLALPVANHWKKLISTNITKKLNDKIEFRKIAKKYNIPHSTGRVCASKEALIEAISQYLNVTNKVIVKQPYSGGTMGNIGISNHEYIFFGVHKSYLVVENNLNIIAEEIWLKYVDAVNSELIVEVYYPNAKTITAILEIDEKEQIKLINTGSIYFQEVRTNQSGADPFTGVQGIEMPVKDISNILLLNLMHYSYMISQYVQRSGYYGLLSVDAIITETEEVIFTEANVRSGGETHINYLINKLFNKSELPFNNASVFASSMQNFNLSIEETLELLKKHQLFFNEGSGIIIISLKRDIERLEYLVVSRDKEHLSELRQKFIKIVESTKISV